MSKRVYNGNMSSRQQGCLALIMLSLLIPLLNGCTDGNTLDLYLATRAYARVTESPVITRNFPQEDPPQGIYLANETATFTISGALSSDSLFFQITHSWDFSSNDYTGPFIPYIGEQIQIGYGGDKVNNLIAYASRDEHNDSRVVGLTNLVIFFVSGDILTRHTLDEGIEGRPSALTFESNERLWYASSEGNLVRLTLNTADPRVLPTLIEPYTHTGFSLSNPQALTYENNTLYIADTGNNRIVSVNTANLTAAPVTLLDSEDGLSAPAGLVLANNLIYIADSGNNRIVSWNSATPAVPFTVLISPNTEIAETPLANPTALAFANNILYIADSGNGRILSFDTTQPGNGASVLLDTTVGLVNPTGLAFGTLYETSNMLYISDSESHRIFYINSLDPASGLQHVAGDTGVDGGFLRGDTMEAIYAILNEPSALALDSQGNVFLADSNNYRIRYIMR